jgi:hypothetical protein
MRISVVVEFDRIPQAPAGQGRVQNHRDNAGGD